MAHIGIYRAQVWGLGFPNVGSPFLGSVNQDSGFWRGTYWGSLLKKTPVQGRAYSDIQGHTGKLWSEGFFGCWLFVDISSGVYRSQNRNLSGFQVPEGLYVGSQI